MLLVVLETKMGCWGTQERHSFSQTFPQAVGAALGLNAHWIIVKRDRIRGRLSFPNPLLAKATPGLPYIYFEFGVILRHVFLDQAIRSFLGLTQAGEGQWQDVLQLHLLLCTWSWSAFLKHTGFYASAGPKTLGFWTSNAHVGISAPDTGCWAGNSGTVRQLLDNFKRFAA